ncbi:protein-glucosylgalactosylhydroxylysine glucosidase isoform X2 [Haematobia irritans]|uniref:protein-glucosylgalactosylhydroxylysine glucosidase isoform X2 n=1 Tax=Haematobia irritans TaxID=7368 RepID=UPI003F4FBF0B
MELLSTRNFPIPAMIVSLLIIMLATCLRGMNIEIGREFLLEPPSLPSDLKFMPSIANGHLGFTVFGDAIYVNGVYNGFKGDSRRARLPNWLNITATLRGTTHSDSALPGEPVVYTMNLFKGYFQWLQNFQSIGVTMRQRVYAHRFYNRALIYDLKVKRIGNSKDPLIIDLQRSPGKETAAFTFIPVLLNTSDLTMAQATTKVAENTRFQPDLSQVFIAFSDNFVQNRKTLQLEKGQNILHYRFILTIDSNKDVALGEIREVLSKTGKEIFDIHCSKWEQFWNKFHIEVEGNIDLSQIINAGIFYMASSLPSLESKRPNNPFYGLSPTGLSRGQLDADYEGHNFWDTEIWMLPVVTQLENSWSQELFNYRQNHIQGAMDNANITGYSGARFPWESAFTGTEVTNPCCPEVSEQEIHISADIAISLAVFYSSTLNKEWLCLTAWPLVKEIANFLCSRTSLNAETGKYHVKNVMGPDEDHENVDDNVYTNVAFQKALEFALFSQGQCSPNSSQSSLDWKTQASNMFILYDALKDYHPQHQGYLPGEEVKQADTILLGYPLQFEMPNSTRYNDLLLYENVSRPSGPAMTWSMFAINFLDVGAEGKAIHYFTRGYKEYVHPEFKVWSETKIGLEGSANFLTGIGGFLQSVINGFAGIRFKLYANNNTAQMSIRNPTMLPDSNGLKIRGLKFANSLFELNIEQLNGITLTCLQLGKYDLELVGGKHNSIPLYTGFKIHFERAEEIIIQTII